MLRFQYLETLYQFGGTIKCEVFKAKIWLLEGDSKEEKISLGDALVYIPMRAEDLAENIIVGREILNKLDIFLENEFQVVIQ